MNKLLSFIVVTCIAVIVILTFFLKKILNEIKSLKNNASNTSDTFNTSSSNFGTGDISNKFKEAIDSISHDEILRRTYRYYKKEISPYPKYDEVLNGTIYDRENKWINEIATHSLKDISELENEDVVLVVTCKFVDMHNGYIRLFLEDAYNKITTEKFKVKQFHEPEGRLLIVRGQVKNQKLYVSNLERTRIRAS